MNVLLMLPNIKEISKILLTCKVEVLTYLFNRYVSQVLAVYQSK